MEKKQFSIKAQAAIVGLILSVILLAAFAILLKPLLAFVQIGVNASMNATEASTLQLILNSTPLFMGLVMLVAIVLMITGRAQ